MSSVARIGADRLPGAAKRRAGQSVDRIRRSVASRRTAVSLRMAAAALLGLATACSCLPFASRSIPDCPGAIRSTDEIPGDFAIRERVTVRSEDGDFPFELIVQKKRRELVLVGLSPMGAKLFTVVQTGTETEVDALPGAVLPIPPLNVLRDLHRLQLLAPEVALSEPDPAPFHHADCGYSIRFETLSAERLP